MIITKSVSALQKALAPLKSGNKTIGFCPTMGALHEGHISLIEASLKETDCTVASIFVNPTQFNNAADLDKYPRTTEKDIEMLEKAGCHVLFLPEGNEMYPAGEALKHYNLGKLEDLLEGKFRPGHYQGVAMIVDKLLQAVQPDKILSLIHI